MKLDKEAVSLYSYLASISAKFDNLLYSFACADYLKIDEDRIVFFHYFLQDLFSAQLEDIKGRLNIESPEVNSISLASEGIPYFPK